jgi:hypothetical protein
VQQERDRRKKEDEELRRQQVDQERDRQQKIAKEWEKKDLEEPSEEPEQTQRLPTPTRNRQSIGVRLPFATSEAPPKPVRSPEPSTILGNHSPAQTPTSENTVHPMEPPAEAPHTNYDVPPVASTTTTTPIASALATGAMAAMRHRRQPSSDDEAENNDAEWQENEPAKAPSFQLQQPPVGHQTAQKSVVEEAPKAPVTHTEPAPMPPRESLPQYDYVPEEVTAPPPSIPQPSQQQHQPSHQHPPHQQYDFVPEDELPPSSATATAAYNAHQQYEEPPYEEIPATAFVAQQHNQSTGNTTSGGGLTAIALFDYDKQDDDEIGFEVNDVITDIEQIDAGWYRGMCKGRFGLFPANYVQLQ